MVSEIDIYRSANAVIRKCGRRHNPKYYAQSKMSQLYDKGDTEGATIWARITNAIDELTIDKSESAIH
jgi:hypothetical protein